MASAGDGIEKTVVVEGGSGGSRSGEGRKQTSGNGDMAHPLSPKKRFTPKKNLGRKKNTIFLPK